ncbi:hypothetical protein [Mesomycoplasma ovipneumoniae]
MSLNNEILLNIFSVLDFEHIKFLENLSNMPKKYSFSDSANKI